MLAKRGWYADFHNERELFVIFPQRVFRYQRGDAESRLEAEAYGRQLGIPRTSTGLGRVGEFLPTAACRGRAERCGTAEPVAGQVLEPVVDRKPPTSTTVSAFEGEVECDGGWLP